MPIRHVPLTEMLGAKSQPSWYAKKGKRCEFSLHVNTAGESGGHSLRSGTIERATPEDVDEAKAWTCAAHIVSQGGDRMGEGYMLRVDDRMFWDNVYSSLAQTDEG